jgi:hypothetical protein
VFDQKVTRTFPTDAPLKSIRAHVWAAEPDAHYVEPLWVPRRLFDVEHFIGAIHDPAVGFGTVVHAAGLAGLEATGSDIVDRTATSPFRPTSTFEIQDFLADDRRWSNLVSNPPYPIVEQFTLQALRVTQHKVAIVFPIARLPAAHWIPATPLRRVWLLSPRPSMPPGHYLAAGKRAEGGKQDFCWLVFEHGFNGYPEMQWLYRDGEKSRTGSAEARVTS